MLEREPGALRMRWAPGPAEGAAFISRLVGMTGDAETHALIGKYTSSFD